MRGLLIPALLAVLILGPAGYGFAAEGKDGEAPPPPGSAYVAVTPSLVANFGLEGRLRYLKLDVSIRVRETDKAAVERNLPWIRHALLMLVSAQDDESIGSMEGRELLRAEALAQVRQIIRDEEDSDGVEDVLFTSFIVQR